jgi:hypothetical protein
MKSKFLPYLLAACCMITIHQLSKAQITIVPSTVVVPEVDPQEFDVVGKSIVKNTSSRGSIFVWEREILSITEGWATAVCDLNACYPPNVNTAEFNLDAGAEGILDVHVYPDGIEGSATISVKVSDKLNPEEVNFTAIYIFNESSTSVPTVEKITNAIRLFPNPAHDWLSIEQTEAVKVHQIELINMKGQSILNQVLFGSNQIHINHLPTGKYIARLFNADGALLSANLISKI